MAEGTNSNIITLYHGSENGLVGDIDVTYSKNVCDFGRGFYLGTDIMQAKNRVCNSSAPSIYTYELNLENRDVYYFEDQVLWALYIARNRGKIDFSGSQKLTDLFSEIDNHDY